MLLILVVAVAASELQGLAGQILGFGGVGEEPAEGLAKRLFFSESGNRYRAQIPGADHALAIEQIESE